MPGRQSCSGNEWLYQSSALKGNRKVAKSPASVSNQRLVVFLMSFIPFSRCVWERCMRGKLRWKLKGICDINLYVTENLTNPMWERVFATVNGNILRAGCEQLSPPRSRGTHYTTPSSPENYPYCHWTLIIPVIFPCSACRLAAVWECATYMSGPDAFAASDTDLDTWMLSQAWWHF